MARLAGFIVSSAILCLGLGSLAARAYARTHGHDEPVDPGKGVKLTSRIPCDGATNPQDQLRLTATFSAGDWERLFRVEVYEENYCKRMDLGFACIMPGHTRWKQEWSADSADADSSHPRGARFGLNACSQWGSTETPQYILTGWYREGGPGSKLPWKQAAVKPLSSRWETYEFADPKGGTARLEIVHP